MIIQYHQSNSMMQKLEAKRKQQKARCMIQKAIPGINKTKRLLHHHLTVVSQAPAWQ
jgi:hypothetical protein